MPLRPLFPHCLHRSLTPLAGLLFLLTLNACTREESRAVSDFLQQLLQQDAWLQWMVSIALVFIFFQLWRIARLILRLFWRAFKQSHNYVFGWSRRNLFLIAFAGTIVWLCSAWIVDGLQYLEQRFWTPVYVEEYAHLSENHLIALYEAELSKRVDPYHRDIIIRRTRETAAKIQSSPLCIYEAAYLECGLNPFTVRSDLVAAGWIQFTRIGLGGLTRQGKPVRFEDVLYACKNKDIDFMMDLSEQYLVDKYERAGKKPLYNTIDLYLALFAPALIGAESTKVVYEGWNNPSYYKNSGLDGWYTKKMPNGRQQIFRQKSRCDGKITIWEMFLCLEAKKNGLVQRYARL